MDGNGGAERGNSFANGPAVPAVLRMNREFLEVWLSRYCTWTVMALRPNVRSRAYAAPVGTPFCVDPADVPEDAVRVIKRTLLRHAPVDPMDDELARLLVAMVITVLADNGAAAEAAEFASEYTAATGAVVAVTAAGNVQAVPVR